MKRILFLAVAIITPLGLMSCAEPEPQVATPKSNSSKLPWNMPGPGQGQGQLGMLPQNQYRR